MSVPSGHGVSLGTSYMMALWRASFIWLETTFPCGLLLPSSSLGVIGCSFYLPNSLMALVDTPESLNGTKRWGLSLSTLSQGRVFLATLVRALEVKLDITSTYAAFAPISLPGFYRLSCVFPVL